ncbi:Endoribonuclease YbeY [bioreactor metagenome]|uniref:Endoribonuclease YbeY n=1 Tax=bioreactor metagenome TaxID=1076179 RepID=A0A644T8R5_9ZZZZ|nr:rRNA maturation RNase YbeY [Negativicutes bacterium]
MNVTPAMEQIMIAVLKQTADIHEISTQVEVSLVLVDDEYIHQLNRDYRGIDRPTDVLSFALDEGEEPDVFDGPEEDLLGDIIISLPTAFQQAEEYNHSIERELAFLTVHGMLHLLGYDHEDDNARQKMRHQEEAILSNLGISRD